VTLKLIVTISSCNITRLTIVEHAFKLSMTKKTQQEKLHRKCKKGH